MTAPKCRHKQQGENIVSKREKRRRKIVQNPINVRFEELQQVLADYGFILKRSRGSHHSFTVIIDGNKELLVVPYKKRVNPIYVNQALELINRIIAEQGLDNEATDDDETQDEVQDEE